MIPDVDWYWVRHAPTGMTGLNGWTDVPAILTDTKTLEFLDSYLPDDSAVLTSDLQRARDTAKAFCGDRLLLPPVEHLREINFGQWEGKLPESIRESDREQAERFWADPTKATPPGGESWQQFRKRVDDYVEEFLAVMMGGSIIVVSHYGVILSQIQQAKQCEISELMGWEIPYYSITRLTLIGDDWVLREFNVLPGS
ncbi:MAG: histidine phosphatase family protein [Rhodobacteraceae bacterium]|nr:histidine phosphatase family protein [Paracoccaceae bacterium]